MTAKNKFTTRIIVLLWTISLICIPPSGTFYSYAEVANTGTKSTVTFTDLKTTHWAYNNIQRVVGLGGIKGYQDNTFKPEGTITYAELTSILLGVTQNDNLVSGGNWGQGMLKKAYEARMFDEGYVPLADAGKAVTRDKMAMILSNTAKALQGESLGTFQDISAYVRDWNTISSAYREYVNQCIAAGLIVGDQSSNFNPSANLTRAEAATICLRLIDKSTRAIPAKYSVETTETYEGQVIALVNKERTAAGLPALKENKKLSEVAKLKAIDIRDKDYFSHTSPTYGSPFDMMKQYGITYGAAGENIAKGHRSPEEVMKGWMNSQGHKENILSSNFTEIGIGYVTDSSGTTFWVQMFIRS